LGALLAGLGVLGVLVSIMVSAVKTGEGTETADAAPVESTADNARDPAAAPDPASVAPVERALHTELEDAKAKGLAALEALAEQNSGDGQVLLALAQARVDAKKYAEAVQAVSSALEVDPKLNTSEKVASLLFTTAQSRSGRQATFQLLEGPMGSRGA